MCSLSCEAFGVDVPIKFIQLACETWYLEPENFILCKIIRKQGKNSYLVTYTSRHVVCGYKFFNKTVIFFFSRTDLVFVKETINHYFDQVPYFLKTTQKDDLFFRNQSSVLAFLRLILLNRSWKSYVSILLTDCKCFF